MKSIHRFCAKALASLMLAGLGLLFVSSISLAQCPTDIYPTSTDPGYVAWTDAGALTIPVSSGCQITSYYCQRMLGDGTWQIYVYEVVPSSGCDAIPPDQLIQDAQNGIYASIVSNGSFPCGFGNYVTQQVFRGACWKLATSSGDPNYLDGFVPCSIGLSSYCAKKCKLCWDAANGQAVISDCTYTVLGTTPDCYALGADGGVWVIGHCYILNCD
jgi:hypothetical protein